MMDKKSSLSPAELVSDIELPAGVTEALEKLLRIMIHLRGSGGCPWDAAQTHRSLLGNLLEEAHEFIHAVQSGDEAAMREELGDLLLQVIFHARIAAERGSFDLGDVARELTEKLVRRHRHVFGQVEVSDADEALASWHSAKRAEEPGTVGLDRVPRAMPALLRASLVQEKAARVGFEWPEVSGALTKLDEELSELRRAIAAGDRLRQAEELGDVLFVLVCVANYIGQCPEMALIATVEKFIRRFDYIERRLAERGLSPEQATLEQMDFHWDEIRSEDRERQSEGDRS